MADILSVAEDTRANLLHRWWAIAGLMLFGATWKLWTPQSVFPQIPLIGWFGVLPGIVDALTFGALLTSLILAAWKPTSWRCWVMFTASLGVLLILDQHRLQPWAWQMLLMAFWWSSANTEGVSNLPSAALTISIYFWSAVSKLDAEFFASHGPTLVDALLGAVGLDATPWSPRWKWALAVCLPLGELLVAIGLCFWRTRRAALIAATVLHIGLILALGPFGLRHRPGVLIWNLAFIGHVWLLFGIGHVNRRASEGIRDCVHRHSLTLRVAWAVILFACLWPMTERWGLCDRWLAWNVYVARSERVSVTLSERGLQRLPDAARQCVVDGELPLDRWSLEALDVPTYPQLRFQFGVVEWLRHTCGDENLIEVMIQHSRGKHSTFERLTREQCDQRRREFWVNTQPRGRSPAGNPP